MSKTVAYFDGLASDWSAKYQNSRFFRQRLELTLKWCEVLRVGSPSVMPRVLDLGCGAGVVAVALAERGFQVTAADVSPEMCKAAEAVLDGLAHTGSRVVLIEEGRALVDQTSTNFDGAICLGVLEYVPDPNQLLSEIARVVAADGWLILSVPNRASLFRRAERIAFTAKALLGGLLKRKNDVEGYLAYQKHQWRLSELDEQLKSKGFTFIRAEYFVSPLPSGNHESIGMNILAAYRKDKSNVVEAGAR